MRTYSYSQIWSIAYPILLSTLMEQLMGMIDTVFLGRVGEVELGASALGSIFFVTIFMLGLGFSIGAQILMARRNGQGHFSEIGSIFYHTQAFLFLMAMALFVFGVTLAPDILRAIIRSPRVFEATDSYLQWRIYSLFFAFIAATFRAFYVGTTKTSVLTLNAAIMVVCNVVFNYVLIFGYCGMPRLGIAGAAIGTTLAQAVSVVFFIVYTCLYTDCAKYGLASFPNFSITTLHSIMKVSIWTMMQNFLSLATWFFFFLAVEHLGEKSLAATNVVRNLSSFTFMTVIALSTTSGTLVSNLMGEGRIMEIPHTMRKIIRLTCFILTPFLLAEILYPELFMRIFTDDDTILLEGRPALYVMVSSYLFTIPAQILFHSVSGTGNTRTSLTIEFISLFIYTVYVGVAILGFKVNLAWGWASEHVYQVVCLVLCYIYLKKANWQTTKI